MPEATLTSVLLPHNLHPCCRLNSFKKCFQGGALRQSPIVSWKLRSCYQENPPPPPL